MGNCAACEDTQEFDQNTEVNLQKRRMMQENMQRHIASPGKENEQQLYTERIEKSESAGKNGLNASKSNNNLITSKKQKHQQFETGENYLVESRQEQQQLSEYRTNQQFQNTSTVRESIGINKPLQATNRSGALSSRQVHSPDKSQRQNSQTFDEITDHIPKQLKKLDALPDFTNVYTKEVLNKFGEFAYDQDEDELLLDLPFFGPCEMENNGYYVGQWRHGQRCGRGKQVWNDGSQYEGYWCNDMANGRGRLIHADGDVFEGSWLNDKAHGKGVYIHRDGASYTGDWFEDKQHGFGVEKWIDGASYEGSYFMGMKHGTGRFEWADGSVYKGEFQNNNIDGQGAYKWADGREYEGDWRDNKMHGKGVFTWKDGRRYVGEYIDDKKQGMGQFNWPDGRVYKGYWENGKQHGRGLYRGSNGREREGEWLEGKKIRWLDE